MKDTSFFDDIVLENKRMIKRRKYMIIFTLLVVVAAGVWSVGIIRNNLSKSNKESQVVFDDKYEDFNDYEGSPSTSMVDGGEAPLPSPQPSSVTSGSSSAVTMDEVNAKLCQDIIENAQASAKLYSSQYYDTQKDWLKTFAYRTDTPEAIEAKQFYINHFKGLFSSLIARNDPMMQSSCKSAGTIESALIIPDFTIW